MNTAKYLTAVTEIERKRLEISRLGRQIAAIKESMIAIDDELKQLREDALK